MRISNKYKRAFNNLCLTLNKLGIKIEQINGKFYCTGNISDSSKVRFRPNKIQVSYSKDKYNKKLKTYEINVRCVYNVFIYEPAVINVKVCI